MSQFDALTQRLLQDSLERKQLRDQIAQLKAENKRLKRELIAADNLVSDYAYVTGMSIPEIEEKARR